MSSSPGDAIHGSTNDAVVQDHHVRDKDVRKIAMSAFVGTALEWYDFFLFGTASALVFNHLYFATEDPVTATLASFATFGVGFLARPLGAILFGKLGDQYGRKPALLLSIVVIGVATGLVGLLPDYHAIGMAAPILLTVLRLLQGIAVGGEWGGATTIAIEHAPPEKRGRYAAMVQLGSPVGTLLSSGAFALVVMLPDDAVDSWGWRVPFLAAFPFLGIALWIRLKVEESPVYQQLAEESENKPTGSLKELFSAYRKQAVYATCAAITGIGGFFIFTTYALSYGTQVLEYDRQTVVNATLLAAAGQLFFLPFYGRLGERYGAGIVMGIGGIAAAILAVPLWLLIDSHNAFLMTMAICIGIWVISAPYGVVGVLLGEMFPAHIRYTGMAITSNIAGAISGLLPFLATFINSFFEEQSSVSAMVLLIIITLLTALGGIMGSKYKHEEN